MAINNTGAMFKSFEFDGTDSRNFGVYITGSGVYNAPEREVEMISIPNRNGAFALDKGRFENIEITYPAGIYADTEADFADGISDLRNFLCSKRGYCRLTDEYNPNEYRMAIYKSGLEVEPALLKAGEFEITFECMPQRFLTSGETEQAITSGGTITNPTLFASSPLLQIWGYGKFGINGAELGIISKPIGNVKVADTNNSYVGAAQTIFPVQYANNGDTISGHLNSSVPGIGNCITAYYFTIDCGSDSIKAVQATSQSAWSSFAHCHGTNKVLIELYYQSNEHYGSSNADSLTSYVTVTLSNNSTKTFNVTGSMTYNGSNTITATQTVGTLPTGYTLDNQIVKVCELWLDSTQSALGSPIYIDLEVGEAYKIENDIMVSVNNAVTIPNDLPTLTSGANTITYDNTITSFKVVPRWWQV